MEAEIPPLSKVAWQRGGRRMRATVMPYGAVSCQRVTATVEGECLFTVRVGQTRRVRTAPARVLALAFVATLVAAGCAREGGTSPVLKAPPTSKPPFSPGPAVSLAPGATTTTTPASTATTLKAGTTATTQAGAATGGSAMSNTGPTPSGGPSGGPQPVAAGTYHYHQLGSATLGTATTQVPADGTLVADPPSPTGTQVLHRNTGDGGGTDTTFTFGPTGMWVTSLTIRQRAAGMNVAFTCRFATPVAAPPWPPSVGASSSGHGTCDGFTADVTTKITAANTASLDGASIATFVVETTVVTHGDVESTTKMIDWFAPSLRLPVHDEIDMQGHYGLVSFGSKVSGDLRSGHPS